MMLAMNLGLGSALLYVFWWIFNFLKDKFLRNLMVSVTIESSDAVYKWLLVYLTENGYLAENMSEVIVKVVKKKRQWYEPKKAKEKTKVEYYPSPGKHFFVYKGKKMWAFQTEGKTQLVGWENKPATEETIVLVCYGSDLVLIQQLIDDAVVYCMEQDKGLLGIYEVGGWLGMWVKVMTKKARPLDSVILDMDLAE